MKIDRIDKACARLADALDHCTLCPHACGVNRRKGQRGYCKALVNPIVYSAMAHHGEEPPISGTRGSGTIFFSHCTMRCLYCQNYRFSQFERGKEMTAEELSGSMLKLQGRGCHNINLVSPTHYLPQILIALRIAAGKGLSIPIVYNTSGYERAETVKLLDGIVDIYLADMRYSDDLQAKRYSDAGKYVKHNRTSIKEMAHQAGPLKIDGDGLAKKGLIIRLLVLPKNISGTVASLSFIRNVLSKITYLSIMSQYFPAFKACDCAELSRRITSDEYNNIVDEAKLLGLNNGWIQEPPRDMNPRFFGTSIRPGEDLK